MATAPKRRVGPARARSAAPNWLAPVCGSIGVLALIAIAAAAWLQWKTLHKIERLLTATQRPWLGASVEPVQLVFDDNGGGITLKMTIKNGGPIPATDVLASSILLLDAKQSFKRACDQHGVGGGIGPGLFKDGAFTKTSTAWLARADFKQSFPNLVAVCIKYRFAGSSRRGETGYLFSIVRRNAPGPDVFVVDPKNGTLDPPELALLPIGSYQD